MCQLSTHTARRSSGCRGTLSLSVCAPAGGPSHHHCALSVACCRALSAACCRPICGSLLCSVCGLLSPCLWLIVVLCLWLVVTLSVAHCCTLVVAEVGIGVICALVVAGCHPCIEENTLSVQSIPAGTHLCHLGHPERPKTIPMELLVMQKTDQTYKS